MDLFGWTNASSFDGQPLWRHRDPGWWSLSINHARYRLAASAESDLVIAVFERSAKGTKAVDWVALESDGTVVSRGKFKNQHAVLLDFVGTLPNGFWFHRNRNHHNHVLVMPRESDPAKRTRATFYEPSLDISFELGKRSRGQTFAYGPWTIHTEVNRHGVGLEIEKTILQVNVFGQTMAVRAHGNALYGLRSAEHTLYRYVLPPSPTLFSRCGALLSLKHGGFKFDELRDKVCADVWQILKNYKPT
jgi:hypothetical protein